MEYLFDFSEERKGMKWNYIARYELETARLLTRHSCLSCPFLYKHSTWEARKQNRNRLRLFVSDFYPSLRICCCCFDFLLPINPSFPKMAISTESSCISVYLRRRFFTSKRLLSLDARLPSPISVIPQQSAVWMLYFLHSQPLTRGTTHPLIFYTKSYHVYIRPYKHFSA